MFREWKVMDVRTMNREMWLERPHYCITFSRGIDGTALLIEREETERGNYPIIVCYDNFDNWIMETEWSKEGIKSKDNLLAFVIGTMEGEWQLRRKDELPS